MVNSLVFEAGVNRRCALIATSVLPLAASAAITPQNDRSATGEASIIRSMRRSRPGGAGPAAMAGTAAAKSGSSETHLIGKSHYS